MTVRLNLKKQCARLFVLSLLAIPALSQAQVVFYFSNSGGSNARLTSASVTSSLWNATFDIFVQNQGITPVTFNAGCLLVGWGTTATEGPGSFDTSPNAVTLFNPGSANQVAHANPNITGRAPWFLGQYGCMLAGGRGSAGPSRPYGFYIPVDTSVSQSLTLAPGQTEFICSIRIKDNGLYASGGSRDLVLYDAGFGGSFTTALFYGPNTPARAGAGWYASSQLTLNGPVANQAPVLDPIGNQSVDEGVALSIDANATDADAGQVLTYSLTGAPAGMSINSSSGVISWTPTEAQGPGSYPFSVVVTDNGTPAANDSEAITVTVNEVNEPPVWASIAPQSASEGTAFTFNAAPFASDPDLPANSLSFSKVGGSSSFNVSSTGVVSGTPGESDGGNPALVTVRVADNGTPAQSADITIVINVAETNEPPVLVNPGTQVGTENTPFSVQLSGSDPDLPAQSLTFAKVSGPTSLSVSPTGFVLWSSPSEADGGTSPTVTVSLSDGTATVQQTFAIQVIEDNQPPVVEGVIDRYGVMGTLFWLVLDVTDPDTPANSFTYSLGPTAPTGMTLDAAGLLKWVPTGAQVGTHTFDIRVTDNGIPAATTVRTVTMRVASAGRLEVWGDNYGGVVSSKPTGVFKCVSSGAYIGTAIRSNGSLASWGTNQSGLITGTPLGQFLGLAADLSFAVGLRTDLSLTAWGHDDSGTINDLPSGTFVNVDLGPSVGVAIRTNGHLAQWGRGIYLPAPPSGPFLVATQGESHGVGIRSNGTLESWGFNNGNVVSGTPAGTFLDVTAGAGFSVAIRSDGTLVAWGSNYFGTVTNVPSGSFVALASSSVAVLALKSDGSLVAWGTDAQGLVNGTPTGMYSDIGSGYLTFQAIRRNTLPTLTNPGPRNATEHSTFSLQLVGSDVETAAASLSYGLVSGPSGMNVSTTGAVSWTPGEAFGGTVQNVTVRVSDGIDTTQQTFAITIAEANGPPNAVSDGLSTKKGIPVVIKVLANDSDPEGQPLHITGVTSTPYGTVTIISGGTEIRFAPYPFYVNKTAKFSYTVADPLGLASTAQVAVGITPPQ